MLILHPSANVLSLCAGHVKHSSFDHLILLLVVASRPSLRNNSHLSDSALSRAFV